MSDDYLIQDPGDPDLRITYLPNCNDTTIYLYMRRGINGYVQNLSFKTGEFTKGKYGLIDDKERCQIENLVQVSYGTLEGGDAGGKSYDLLPSDDNYFSINSIDRIQNLVTGGFRFHYLAKIMMPIQFVLRKVNFRYRTFGKANLKLCDSMNIMALDYYQTIAFVYVSLNI